MDALRRAIRFSQQTLKIERLLLSQQLRTRAGKVLLDRYGELIELSASGQIAMRRLLQDHLDRIEWDKWKLPVRLYPVISSEGITATRPVSIDPNIAFGRPVLATRGSRETLAALAQGFIATYPPAPGHAELWYPP